MEDIGCFGLTELGYGNNAVEMETTAIYDKDTKEFIVNTPHPLAQKYWITNGAIHAKHIGNWKNKCSCVCRLFNNIPLTKIVWAGRYHILIIFTSCVCEIDCRRKERRVARGFSTHQRQQYERNAWRYS